MCQGTWQGWDLFQAEATMCAKVRGDRQHDQGGEPEWGVAAELRVWVSHEEMGPEK